MNRYKISQLAEQDLEDIWVYLAQNNQIAWVLYQKSKLLLNNYLNL